MALQEALSPLQPHRPSFGNLSFGPSWASSLLSADRGVPPRDCSAAAKKFLSRSWGRWGAANSAAMTCGRTSLPPSRAGEKAAPPGAAAAQFREGDSTLRLHPQRTAKLHHRPAKVEGRVRGPIVPPAGATRRRPAEERVKAAVLLGARAIIRATCDCVARNGGGRGSKHANERRSETWILNLVHARASVGIPGAIRNRKRALRA